MGGKIRELFDVARLYVTGTPEEIRNYKVELSEKAYWPVAMAAEGLAGIACAATVWPLSIPILFDFMGRVADRFGGNRYTPAGIIGLGRYDRPEEGEKPDQAGGLQLTPWE